MWPRLRSWFSPPSFPDREVTRVASALHVICLFLGLTLVFWVFVYPMTVPEPWTGVALSLLALVLITSCLVLAHRGHVRVASWVLIGMIWTITSGAITVGGLQSPAFSAYIIAVVTAGLLQDRIRAGLVALASVVYASGIAILEVNNLLPSPAIEQTELILWGVEATLIGTAAGVVAIYLTQIRDAERELAVSREVSFQSQKMEALGRLAGGI